MRNDLPSRPRRLLGASLLLAAVAFAPEVRAREISPTPGAAEPQPDRVDRPKRSVHLDTSAVTEVPLLIGAQVTLELPLRFLVQAEVGWLPGAYIGLVDGILGNVGAYGTDTSALVRSARSVAPVVRASVGIRPFAPIGLEVLAGYTFVRLGGDATAGMAYEAATDEPLPSQIPDQRITTRTTLHNVHVGVGWRWVVADRLVVRASIAYMQCVGAASRVDFAGQGQGTRPEVAAAGPVIGAYLNDTFKTYVKTPVMGLSFGYRF
jgi:hypothetical protein